MEKKLLISTIFTFAINGHVMAQAIDPLLLQGLDEINHQKVPIDYRRFGCEVQNFTAESKIKEETVKDNKNISSCFLEMCGPPGDDSAFVTDSNFEKYLSDDIKKKTDKLDPLMLKILSKVKDVQLSNVLEIEKNLLKDGDLDLHPEKWSESFRENVSYEIFSPYLDIQINKSGSVDNRVKINTINTKGLSAEFAKKLEKYAKDYEVKFKNSYYEFGKYNIYSSEEMNGLVSKRVSALKGNFSKLSPDEKKSYEKELEEGINKYEKYYVFASLGSLEKKMAKKFSDKTLSYDSAICEGESCKEIYQDFFKAKNVPQFVKGIKNDLNDPKAFTRATNKCKAQLVAKLNVRSDQEKAEKILKNIRGQVEKNILPKFSSTAQKEIKGYLNNIKVETFHINSLLEQNPIESFEREAKHFFGKTNEGLRENDKLFAEGEEDSLFKLMKLGQDSSSYDTFSTMGSPCITPHAKNAWDSYVSGDAIKYIPPELIPYVEKDFGDKGHIYISDFSVKNESSGKLIVAHELGHAISNVVKTGDMGLFGASSYKKMRECVTKNYVHFESFEVGPRAQKGDGLQTEEDLADLIMAMTYPDEKVFATCALIEPSKDRKSYTASGAETDFGDSHSTPFIRLMMEAINKNMPLPSSCQSAMVPMKDVYKFKKCAP